MPMLERQVRLHLPLRLKGGLNARGHWRVAHARVLKERQAVALAFKSRDARESLQVAKGCNSDGKWDVTLTRIAPRKMDRGDNLPGVFKAVRDEVAKAIGIDDGSERLEFHYAQCKGKVREYAIEIEIQSHHEWRLGEMTRLAMESMATSLSEALYRDTGGQVGFSGLSSVAFDVYPKAKP